MKTLIAFSALIIILIIAATIKFEDSYIPVEASKVFAESSATHWLGTDSLGRDYFWRLILALRTSVLVALGGTVISFFLGIILGSWAALSNSALGFSINRFFDVVQGLPSFLFLAVIMQFYSSSSGLVSSIALALYCGVFHWPQIARLTRAQLTKVMQEPYVEAARSLGGTKIHILKKHLWPACYQIWFTWTCFHIPMEVMFESTLSFLGFGIKPPQTSLGLLIQEGWKYLDDKPIFLFAPASLCLLLVLVPAALLKRKRV